MVQQVADARVRVSVDDRTRQGFARVARSVRSVTRTFAIGTAAVAATSAGIFALARSGGVAATNLNVLSRQFGLSAQRVLELQTAIEESGGSADTMNRSLQRFTQNLVQAVNEGTGPLRDNLDNLGLTMDQFRDRIDDTEGSLRLLFDALSAIPDEAERAGVAAQILGRRYLDLFNAIQSGTLDQVQRDFQQLGVAIDQSLIDRAEAANSAFDRVQGALKLISLEFRAALAPVLETVARGIRDLIPKINEMVASFAAWVKELAEFVALTVRAETTLVRIEAAVGALYDTARGFVIGLGALVIAAVFVFAPLWTALVVGARRVATVFTKSKGRIGKAMSDTFKLVRENAGKMIKSVLGIFGKFAGVVALVVVPLVSGLNWLLDRVGLSLDFFKNFNRRLEEAGVASKEAAAGVDELSDELVKLNALVAEYEGLRPPPLAEILRASLVDLDVQEILGDKFQEVDFSAAFTGGGNSAADAIAHYFSLVRGELSGQLEGLNQVAERYRETTGGFFNKIFTNTDVESLRQLEAVQVNADNLLATLQISYENQVQTQRDFFDRQNDLAMEIHEQQMEVNAGNKAALEEAEREHWDRIHQIQVQHHERTAQLEGAFARQQTGIVSQEAGQSEKVEKGAQKQRLSNTLGYWQQSLAVGATYSKKAFEANKAVQLGSAIIAGYRAAAEAWAFGMPAGPAVAAALAAASIAFTALQIGAIQRQQFGGGGGGAGGSPGGIAVGGTATEPFNNGDKGPNNQIFLNFQGQGPIAQQDVRDAIVSLSEELGEGGTVDVFSGATRN